MSFQSIVRIAVVLAVTCLTTPTLSAQITIPTVTIGNPRNAPDTVVMTDGTFGYGSVGYAYGIGKYEVTNAQYAAFLNAKAKSDPNGLYNTDMAGEYGGITRFGSPGSYTYATISGRENHPVNFVSFWDATRFANWLHNGQEGGDTEAGAYTLTPGGISANTIARNSGWQWAVTTEDEWYKAAYHQPASTGGDADNYWLYPVSSNAINTSQANFVGNGTSSTWPVGSYAANYYGAFDMGGNVWEWNETVTFAFARGLRGGSFAGGDIYLRADFRFNYFFPPSVEAADIGFRVSRSVAPCRGDFDGSGFVDSDDFILFVFAFSRGCTAPRVPVPGCFDSADFDQSGFVDSDDYIAFVADFERGC